MNLDVFPKTNEVWKLNIDDWVYVNFVNILPNLHQYLLDSLGSDYSYVVSYSNNSDIQKFILSLSVLDFQNKFPTLQGLLYTLDELDFERVSKVTSVGEWTIKGDLVSFWPVGYSHPIRVSFFGDDVESIEVFDEVYSTKLFSLREIILGKISKIPDFVDRKSIEIQNLTNRFKKLVVILSKRQFEQTNTVIDFDITEEFDFEFPEIFFKNFKILEKRLLDLESAGFRIYIQTNHLDDIPKQFHKYLIDNDKQKMDSGFISKSNNVCLITDRELFGTIFLTNRTKNISSKQAKRILERLEGEIEIDDYVVHEDHGIGIYKGIIQRVNSTRVLKNFEWINLEEKLDYMKVDYADGDELLVPISQLQKITKYLGTTDEEPQITRLHKGTWKNIISKTKKAIKVIARDLVEHYAKLELATTDGLDYTHSPKFEEFVDNFPYTETPDQLQVCDEIFKDLTLTKPMDRLIVGDVGFGKTEVAMRTAFKVVENGLQVAVLCPTTVLANQHYKVFKDRFAGFDFNIEYISRFNLPNKNSDIIGRANSGSIDILIGTHRLLSNDVEFKNLGLIVIDEEQKFGVKQKEKIRKLQYSAHTLSMTATPIPRTLSMAMSEIKDISIMTTPPKERMSVHTEVEKQDWNKIVSQLEFEYERGGQSYFVHNRVETIESITHKLSTLLPNLKFGFAHGQMNPRELDKTINEFYNKKLDVLVCSTIIENGIDMPNVNTIIINDGQNFGLGQLYQLRGRVGRSNIKAYCYIYYKGSELKDDEAIEEKKDVKPQKYIQRLKAIMESQELGSGFKLASRDLEIRGAGSLLGEQQHGNIKNVGLGLYMQMLAEEVELLKASYDSQTKGNS